MKFKKYNMIKKPQVLIATIALVLLITACDKEERIDRSTPYGKGVAYARAVNDSVYSDYLQCYALSHEKKAQCVDYLRQKYLTPSSVKDNAFDQDFIKGFQFESEKLGFKNFILQAGNNCSGVRHGPEFDESKQAHLLECLHGREYWVKFDPKSKSWNLMQNSTNVNSE